MSFINEIEWKSIDSIYNIPLDFEPGQRLGIDYIRSLKDVINIQINDKSIEINQLSLGVLGISGVVWDAGLLLIDFLVYLRNNKQFSFGKVLDVGCGTGICGIGALLLNANEVVFTDMNDLLENNILNDYNNYQFISYDWSNMNIPKELTNNLFDVIMCSDLIYHNINHNHLLTFLSNLSFNVLIISYKRRNDSLEQQFFNQLNSWCDLYVLDTSVIPLVNIAINQLNGLYLIIGIRKSVKSNEI